MFNEIRAIENHYGSRIIAPLDNNLYTLLGKIPNNMNPEMMLYFYKAVAKNVYTMYDKIVEKQARHWVIPISNKKHFLVTRFPSFVSGAAAHTTKPLVCCEIGISFCLPNVKPVY